MYKNIKGDNMKDKIKELASTIVNYSLNVKEDEKVLITYQSIDSRDLVKEIINEINLRKGIAYTNYVDPLGSLSLAAVMPKRVLMSLSIV